MAQENHIDEVVQQFQARGLEPQEEPDEAEQENPEDLEDEDLEELEVGIAEGLPDEPEDEESPQNTLAVRYTRGGSLEFQYASGEFYTVTQQPARLPQEVALWACNHYDGLIVPA